MLGTHPFTRDSFGLGRHPDGIPELLQLLHDEESIGSENNWHTDLSAQRAPPTSSLLLAKVNKGGTAIVAGLVDCRPYLDICL